MNQFDVSTIDSMSDIELASENGETLYQYQTTINNLIAMNRNRKEKLDYALRRKYSDRAKQLREKDSGVVHMPDAGVIVTCEARKTVSWDQKMLLKIRDNIAAQGDDPNTYINVKQEYRVLEAVWNSWGTDSWQQKSFMNARTVKVAESFTLRLNDEKP